MTVRAQRTAWVLFGSLVIGLAMWWWHTRPIELTVAFLERTYPDLDTARQGRQANFGKIHRITIDQLVTEFNANNKNVRLRLLDADTPPTDAEATDYSKFLSSRYAKLAKRRNLAAVFDNSWGTDIEPIAEKLRSFPAPIVFLNADRNGLNFGEARLFVGNADQVPSEISALLPKLLVPLGDVQQEDVVFVTESDYKLGDRFKEALSAIDLTRNQPIEIPGKRATNRGELSRRKAQIISQFLRDSSWDVMQERKKLLILNSHSDLGEELIPWLDLTFRKITVIGYQSMLSRAPGFTFGVGDNQLILLSNSTQLIPEDLYLRYRRLKKGNEEVFARDDAPFYVRRCVVAIDICTEILRNRNWDEFGPASSFLRPQLSHSCARLRGSEVHSSIGELQFSSEGEMLGQNRFLLYKNRSLSSYSFQPTYRRDSKGNEEISIVPSVHCGIRNVHVRDIDIARGELHAEMDYWIRERMESGGADSTVPIQAGVQAPESINILLPIDFKPEALADDIIGKAGQRLLATKKIPPLRQRTFHTSGTFDAALNGWGYPFDRHKIKLEFKGWAADDKLRLSRTETLGGQEPIVDGWKVGDWYIALNTRETNPIPLSDDSKAGESSQYDIITLTIDVRRRLWNSLLLLVAPMGLLIFGSLAVLFIKFGVPAPDTPIEKIEHEDFEERKTQTELSIGSVLAIITYLISYAALVPRLQTLLYSDILVGFGLFVAMANFVFVVAVRARKTNRFVTWLTLERYRRVACWLAILGFLGWIGGGVVLQTVLR